MRFQGGVLSLMFVLQANFSAAAATTTYYMGDYLQTSPGGTTQKSLMFLQKTYDPDRGLAIERGIQVNADDSVSDSTITFTITGNNFTVSDTSGKMNGKGTFTGTPWGWTFFKATYNFPSLNLRVDDENTLADPSVVTGRKTVYVNGQIVQVIDTTLKQITESSFQLLTGPIIKNAQNEKKYKKD